MELLPFVDTHVHFWNLDDPTLRYDFLTGSDEHAIIGDINGVRVRRFSVPEYRAQTRFQNVTKVVHVQVSNTPDPVAETRWVSALADRTGLPTAIVGLLRLGGEDAVAQLEGHASFDRVRGVRSFEPAEAMADPHWQRNFARLEQHGLVFCHMFSWPDKQPAYDLAVRHPGVTVCVDQASMPRSRDEDYFQNWRAGLRKAAAAPNVVCKISSLGMTDQRWTVASMRRWVLSCVEIFGPDRAFFGSNWPMDSLFSAYPDLVNAFRELVAEFSVDEQRSLLAGTAERVFRI